MIKVIFFAALKEQLDSSELSLDIADGATMLEVKQMLVAENPQWQPHLEEQSLLMAINHEMVSADTTIKSGDEVAFFPPVTGG